MANDIDVLKKEMNKATFSNDEISGVIFLKALMSFDPANVFDLHKQFSNSGLDKKVILEFTKINRLDSKMIKAFFKYKPSTNGKDVMKEFGVKGPDIALKINQIEAEKFKSLI